jgi:hypothetical protein
MFSAPRAGHIGTTTLLPARQRPFHGFGRSIAVLESLVFIAGFFFGGGVAWLTAQAPSGERLRKRAQIGICIAVWLIVWFGIYQIAF